MLRFGKFQVDREGRELYCGDEAIALQPKVFELMLLLIDHRERVVSKDELLSALWPGVVVTEGSLQRVISLLRQALRPGGGEDYVRTYHRLGYRFVGDLLSLEPAVTRTRGRDSEPLQAARAALADALWDEALAHFVHADRSGSGLDVRALLDWALSAQCGGRLASAVEPLERALRLQTQLGEHEAAARTSVALARVQAERQLPSMAEGWLRHAERLLEHAPDSEAAGHAAWLRARFSVVAGQHQAALTHAERAERIGRAHSSPDLIALGLSYQAHACFALGQIELGTARINEAATLVLGGNVHPLAGGLVYCGVLYTSHNRHDWSRAIEWNASFEEWCQRSRINVFPGVCRLHHAELLAVRGELEDAERELLDSADDISTAAAWAEGDAYRVLGDIQRLRGDLSDAETSYRRALELGWDPQPGYAELFLAKGDPQRAVRSLEMSLMDDGWSLRQRRSVLLAVLAACAARAGDVAKAQARLQEFDAAESEGMSTPAHLALRAEAAAEISRALDDVPSAVVNMQKALRGWIDIGAPLIVARVRDRLARMLDALETK
jgi:DNA-binding winged helix-turn-helix (wHTH) protein